MVLAVLIVSVLLAVFVREVLLRVLRGLDFDRRAESSAWTMPADWSQSRSAVDWLPRAA